MNRPLTFGPDGGVVLRPGRVYRLMVIVTGETTAEDLEDALVAAGFQRAELCTSTPRAWPQIRPPDWPDEPPVDLAANECIVRVGAVFGGEPRAFARDMPISGSKATFTIAAAWDYAPTLTNAAPAPAVQTGGAPKPAASDSRGLALVITAAALFGWRVWTNIRGERRIQRETQRMRAVIERDEREAIDRRVRDLMRTGHSREDALALVERERGEAPAEPLDPFAELEP